MHVSTKGVGSRALSFQLRQAAQFYARELMSERLCQTLDLEIVVKKNDKTFREAGLAEWLDQTPRPKEFRIIIAHQKKKDFQEYFKILAHEMVHVKQYAKDEMTSLIKVVKKGKVEQYWRGSSFALASKRRPVTRMKKVITDDRGRDYYYQPWEVEAFGLEVGLYNYYVEKYGDR